MYVNFSTVPETTRWVHLRTQVLPPCTVPAAMQTFLGGGLQIRVLGDGEPLLKSAVQSGVKLKDAEIRQLMRDNGIAEPKKKPCYKRDRVAAVVQHFFPGATSEEHEQMVEGMAGPKAKVEEVLECPQDILDYIQSLDPDNVGAFKYVLKVAQDVKERRTRFEKLDSKKKGGGDAQPAEQASSSAGPAANPKAPLVAHEDSAKNQKWASHTPVELHDLLPGRHSLPFVYLKVHGNRYQGVYQCQILTYVLFIDGRALL